MSKLYRSANGKVVDLDQLMLKSEDSIAVGNMKVNARGDELGPGGKIIKTRNQRVAESYKLHTMVPTDDVVHADAASAAIPNGLTPDVGFKPIEESRPASTAITEKQQKPAPTANKRQRGGLAASIAKTRTMSEDPAKESKSIKRIQNGGQ